MITQRNNKAIILKAYFENLISKDQMEGLLNEGINSPPIPWIWENEEAQRKDREKREILSRVLGVTFQKVVWI